MLSLQMRAANIDDYKAIQTPVCIIVGDEDRLTPATKAQAIKGALDSRPASDFAQSGMS